MWASLVLIVLPDIAIVMTTPLFSFCTPLFFLRHSISFFLGVLLQMAVHAIYIFNAKACSENGYLYLLPQFRVDGDAPFRFIVTIKA